MSILSTDRIQLQATATDKSDAIRQAGELLVASGCVEPNYVNGMLTREETMSTFIGNGVAIPHGTYDNLGEILSAGISVLQLPDGVIWEEEDGEISYAYLVIGIAAGSDEHMSILMNLAEVVEDEDAAKELATTTDIEMLLERLNREPEPELEETD